MGKDDALKHHAWFMYVWDAHDEKPTHADEASWDNPCLC